MSARFGMSAPDFPSLLSRFVNGDRRALARILSLVENGETSLAAPTHSTCQSPSVVGIAGSGGAGKSTLIAAIVTHLRDQERSVAVLASDPASPLTGGALLGDRIRVSVDPQDDGVFFRSLSTRGAAGGIADATERMIPWLAGFGFDVVLLETVGTGQDQVAVHRLVDCLVLLVTPASGDEVQWEKAGVIELADVIVVNKSDLAGAQRVQADLLRSLTLLPQAQAPPVLAITATTGAGVPQLWDAIEKTLAGRIHRWSREGLA